uniref:Uncharacterized protein n=1 Tax=Cryptococcus bacillisporus CA1280 TaxID=1296109 RepID=A0A0D0VUX6_CRYGA|nr:hypothetical protein I312_00223 [Cryptococcus bacillisporus CA1280]
MDSGFTFRTPHSPSLFDNLRLVQWPKSWLYRAWCRHRVFINPLSADGVQSCGHRSGKPSKSNGRAVRRWCPSDHSFGAFTIEHRAESIRCKTSIASFKLV